jgi:hypothetical protein
MKRTLVLLLLIVTASIAGAPKKPATKAAPKPSPIAPTAVAHPIALFLNQLSNDGKRQVTFKASAIGTRFYFEEPAGVTVYRFENGQYVKEAFLAGAKLPTAMKRYPKL